MTPRTFFIIFIKILGLYLVLQSFSVLPQFVSTLASIFGDWENNFAYMVTAVLTLTISIGVYFFIIRYMIFKTDWFVNRFALDKSFSEDKFEMNIHRSVVLSIAVIVIGGITVVDAIPALCKEVYFYLQERKLFGNSDQAPKRLWILFYAVKVFIGCLLMIYQRTIVNFIEYKRKN